MSRAQKISELFKTKEVKVRTKLHRGSGDFFIGSAKPMNKTLNVYVKPDVGFKYDGSLARDIYVEIGNKLYSQSFRILAPKVDHIVIKILNVDVKDYKKVHRIGQIVSDRLLDYQKYNVPKEPRWTDVGVDLSNAPAYFTIDIERELK